MSELPQASRHFILIHFAGTNVGQQYLASPYFHSFINLFPFISQNLHDIPFYTSFYIYGASSFPLKLHLHQHMRNPYRIFPTSTSKPMSQSRSRFKEILRHSKQFLYMLYTCGHTNCKHHSILATHHDHRKSCSSHGLSTLDPVDS